MVVVRSSDGLRQKVAVLRVRNPNPRVLYHRGFLRLPNSSPPVEAPCHRQSRQRQSRRCMSPMTLSVSLLLLAHSTSLSPLTWLWRETGSVGRDGGRPVTGIAAPDHCPSSPLSLFLSGVVWWSGVHKELEETSPFVIFTWKKGAEPPFYSSLFFGLKLFSNWYR